MLVFVACLFPALLFALDSIAVFNEIHYHPAGNSHSNEFVELYNQLSVDVDLSGWELDGGVAFTFPEGTVITGGSYLVVAADPGELQAATGFGQALGPYAGRLDNNGESLVLKNNNGRVMDALVYGDAALWPLAPDGSGASLGKIDPLQSSTPAANWEGGSIPGGTPGRHNSGEDPMPIGGRYYPLDGTFADASGRGVAGSLVGAVYNPDSPPGLPGLSLQFDGVDDYGEILDGADPLVYTLACWVKVDAIRAQSIIVRTSAQGPTTHWSHQLRMDAVGHFVHYMFDGSGRTLTGSTVALVDTWYHVAVTVEANNQMTLFVNGIEDVAPGVVNTPWADGDRWRVGSNSGHGMTFLDGQIDDLAIWSEVLDTSDLLALGTGEASPGDTLIPVDPEDVPTEISIQELAAVTSNVFWVELLNYGLEDVDLEGLVLASSAGAEAVLPAQLLIAGTRTVLDEAALGFRPVKDDKLFLYAPQRATILDAGQVKNRLKGRLPTDPRGAFYTPAAPSPGATNSFAFVDDIVINEIMYHHRPDYGEPGGLPGDVYAENDEEWIEIFNRSSLPVVLDGWAFREGVRYTFPSNTVLAAGAYLVVARDATVLASKFPAIQIMGHFEGSLANRSDQILLVDAHNNPVDRVAYADGAPWPAFADGGGSSLELIHPEIDNRVPHAWASSLNEPATVWTNISFTVVATNPVFSPGIRSFHELRLGLLDAGEVLIDDVSVIEDPAGAARELIQNGSFNTTNHWRLLGTHSGSSVGSDGGENVLHLRASGSMNYMYNLLETTFKSGGSLVAIQAGTAYRIAFRAKWLHGSPQLHTEFYYNKIARTFVLPQPLAHGTPGETNSVYRVNPGPTFSHFAHEPAVPRAGDVIPVSLRVQDPDGVATVVLHVSINESAFQVFPMSVDADGKYRAEIPTQVAGTICQIYVEGMDTLGAVALHPAAGPDARALIKVNDGRSQETLQNLRIIMLPTEADFMHHPNELLSNERIGCTIIYNETEIYYGCGIRLRGSMFSRQGISTTALNLRFPADQPFRGLHKTITVRRGNIREILAKHLINVSGGIHDNYNDIIYLSGHIAAQTGPARLEMARFGSVYLDGLPGKAPDGAVFKMEGIRDIQGTTDGDPESPKTPFPVGWISNYDFTNLGADPEQYRHSIRINGAKAGDDYTPMLDMCRMFGQPDAAMEAAAPGVIDVDRWLRQFAMMSLLAINDTYTQGNPHNLNMFVRPDTGLIESMPWDWDSLLARGTTAPLWGNKNMGRLIARPVNRRAYYCHLLDLMNHRVNRAYFQQWATHFGQKSGENYAGYVDLAEQRAAYVMSQLPSAIPFEITSNGGNAFAFAGSRVPISGDGWIDVRSFRLEGVEGDLLVTWLDAERWEVELPLGAGTNTFTLHVFNHQGVQVGSDSITVTNSGSVVAASAANTVVSELMSHPVSNGVEYIELMNIDPVNTIDLGDVAFVDGLDFVFPVTNLPPLQRILVVEDLGLFRSMYPGAIRVAGIFQNSTGLKREGERISIQAVGGALIQSFTYDNGAPWPEEVPGGGVSLVLIAPKTHPDHNLAENWRPSAAQNGQPGLSDAISFVGDPDEDVDGDGFVLLVEYLAGSSDHDALDGPRTGIQREVDGRIYVTFPLALGSDQARWYFEYSPDLQGWTRAHASDSLGIRSLGNGRGLLRWRFDPLVEMQYGRLRVEWR